MTPQGSTGPTERRRAPRLRIRGRLSAVFLTTPLPIAIRNISLLGMLVESAEAFPVGTLHQFRMTINGDDSEGSPVLTAECVHCHPELLPDGATSYLSGFMFTGTPGDEAERQIFDLLDTATSAASY
ncbi:MAG TPA: PilZ domain-containing protein [Vicinamibacterales bacterium]